MSELEKVRIFIKENNMIEKNDSVIVGLSGGADSVCLTDILYRLKDEFGFDMTAVHVNHGIRGEEAKRDMDFAEKICQERGIRFISVSYDIPGYAKENRISEEEAGRIKRYETFEKIRQEIEKGEEQKDKAENGEEENPLYECELKKKGEAVRRNVKIAVAHNLDDSVETFLHNLCRGSGLLGITGIRAVNGHIIRPVLCLFRKEIENYLNENSMTYIDDSTNFSLDYTRNKIRNKIIPYFNENINSKSSVHIMETAKDLSEAENYINEQAKRIYNEIFTEKSGCIYAEKSRILQAEDIIQKRLVRLAVMKTAKAQKDITRRHIEDIVALCKKQSGRYITLPYHVIVKNEGKELIFTKNESGGNLREKKCTKEENEKINVEISGTGEYKFGKYIFTVEFIDAENEKKDINFLKKYIKNKEKMYTKWFDCDKICSTLLLRTRKTGDYLTVNSEGGTKKLKSYFIDEKIPASERDDIPCVADGNHIMWVCGHRISEHYKITEKTKKIMKITVSETDAHLSCQEMEYL